MNTGSDAVLLAAESFLNCIRGQIEVPSKHLYHRLSSLRNLRTLGEGEGKDRVIVKQTLVHREGLYLRELWVDARTTSSNAEETLSPADYQILLGMQGAEELESTKETVEFSGEMLDVNQYRYGVDYNLGDKVSVVNEYGIKGTAIVTEITEVEDENGYKIVPTFSEWS